MNANKVMFLLSFILITEIFPKILIQKYPGYTLSPYDNTIIQLKSQKVDIYWGEFCRIEAEYILVNPTDKTFNLKIGFPVNTAYVQKRFKTAYSFMYEMQKKHPIKMDSTNTIMISDSY